MLQTHRFIRSDLFANPADAERFMVQKAHIFIDQMGIACSSPQTYRQHRLMMSAALDELRQALARTGERRLIWLEGDEADCIARAEALLSGASYWLGTARANTTRNRRPRRCSGSVRSATRLCLILSAVFTPTHSGRWRAPCGQAVCCCC